MSHAAGFLAVFILGVLLVLFGSLSSLWSETYERYRARGFVTWGITVGRTMAILGGLCFCCAAIVFLFDAQ